MRRRTAGFTFVEILAALTFIAIVLPVVLRGLSLATATAGQVRQVAQATALCDNRMAELSSLPDIIQYPSLSGEFPEMPGYRWESELLDWQDSGLKELVVRVKWDTPRGERTVELATLLYPEGQTP